MGNSQCVEARHQSLEQKYCYVESISHPLFGSTKIYRKRQPLFDYVQLVEQYMHKDRIELIREGLAHFKEEFIKASTNASINCHKNEGFPYSPFLRVMDFKIEQGISACESSKLSLYIEYMRHDLKHFLAWRRQSQTPLSFEELVMTIRATLKAHEMTKSNSIVGLSLAFQNVYVTLEGQIRFDPLTKRLPALLSKYGVNCGSERQKTNNIALSIPKGTVKNSQNNLKLQCKQVSYHPTKRNKSMSAKNDYGTEILRNQLVQKKKLLALNEYQDNFCLGQLQQRQNRKGQVKYNGSIDLSGKHQFLQQFKGFITKLFNSSTCSFSTKATTETITKTPFKSIQNFKIAVKQHQTASFWLYKTKKNYSTAQSQSQLSSNNSTDNPEIEAKESTGKSNDLKRTYTDQQARDVRRSRQLLQIVVSAKSLHQIKQYLRNLKTADAQNDGYNGMTKRTCPSSFNRQTFIVDLHRKQHEQTESRFQRLVSELSSLQEVTESPKKVPIQTTGNMASLPIGTAASFNRRSLMEDNHSGSSWPNNNEGHDKRSQKQIGNHHKNKLNTCAQRSCFHHQQQKQATCISSPHITKAAIQNRL